MAILSILHYFQGYLAIMVNNNNRPNRPLRFSVHYITYLGSLLLAWKCLRTTVLKQYQTTMFLFDWPSPVFYFYRPVCWQKQDMATLFYRPVCLFLSQKLNGNVSSSLHLVLTVSTCGNDCFKLYKGITNFILRSTVVHIYSNGFGIMLFIYFGKCYSNVTE